MIFSAHCAPFAASIPKVQSNRSRFYELPDLCPPHSSELNPVNYKICGIIQQRVYQTKVQSVNDLRQRQMMWAWVEQIDNANEQRRSCLHNSIQAILNIHCTWHELVKILLTAVNCNC